jgi:catechol 2,3-dioxygenase-like lactoylglutathione lyase family enzyme
LLIFHFLPLASGQHRFDTLVLKQYHLANDSREFKNMSKVSVRYIVANVDEAIPFYTEMLGFQVEMHPAPGFASLSLGDLRLFLNQPGAGGAGQTMPDGHVPEPGGWNRIQIEADDLAAMVEKLKKAGCHFRSEIITGNGGKQILVDDPSGNPIELFQPF